MPVKAASASSWCRQSADRGFACNDGAFRVVLTGTHPT